MPKELSKANLNLASKSLNISFQLVDIIDREVKGIHSDTDYIIQSLDTLKVTLKIIKTTLEGD
jgi:hypothetical protein